MELEGLSRHQLAGRDALLEYIGFFTGAKGVTKYKPLSEAVLKSCDAEGFDGYSHTFFNGGKAKADPETCDRAARMYAMDIVRTDTPEKVTTIERIDPQRFPLFIDVDLKTFAAVDAAAVTASHGAYWNIVLEQIRRFFTKRDPSDPCFRVIICTRRPEMIPDTGGLKFGYHLHFPDLVVDVQRALYIRESIVTAMLDRFGERTSEGNCWDDVFDGAVYGNNGLRPFGSYKKGGRVAYWPRLALMGTGEPDEQKQSLIDRVMGRVESGDSGPRQQFAIEQLEALKNDNDTVQYIGDLIALVQMTRLRVRRDLTDGWAPWSGAPAPSFRRNGSKQIVGCTDRPPGGGLESVNNMNRKAVEVITALIRSAMPTSLSDMAQEPIWPKIRIRDLYYVRPTKKGGTACAVVSVRGEGCSKCLNMHARGDTRRRGGDHTSNHIYFIVRPQHPVLQQRCFSKNGLERRYCHCTEPVPCKEFCSARHLVCTDTHGEVRNLFNAWSREGVAFTPSLAETGKRKAPEGEGERGMGGVVDQSVQMGMEYKPLF